ncbi:MAG: hydrogenase, partial [Desulfamplus sp.]|nr:hydrogenase [Desulfamplus sp.]
MNKSSFDLFKSFAGELDPISLQKKFLLALLKLQNVERGSIWIKKNHCYHCIEAAGKESENIIGIDIDEKQKSIVGWVIEN